jgi:hypothetical protein
MAAVKKMAILRVTAEAVRDLLQLPAGVEVLRVEVAPGVRGCLNVVIEGAGWDTPEGGLIVPTYGTVHTKCDEVGYVSHKIDWRFPAEAPQDV